MQKKDDHRYRLEGSNEKFTAAQFTDDFQVHVDAHSASPVFVDDHKQLAFALAKGGAIGPKGLLRMTKPPKLNLLGKEYEELENAKAATMKQMMDAGMVPGSKGLKSIK